MADLAQHGRRQIPQRILVLRDFCIRASGIACARCAGICPADAITLPEAPRTGEAGGKAQKPSRSGMLPAIDAEACIGCGICQGACDAFSSTQRTLADIHAEVRRSALAQPGRAVVLTCREQAEGAMPALNVVVLPCLAMMPAELWTQLLCEGTPLSVALDLGRCDSCIAGARGAEDAFTQAIVEAEAASSEKVGFSASIPQKADEGFFASLAQAGADGNRRDALFDIVAELKDAASGNRRRRTDAHLHDLIEQRERRERDERLALGPSTHFNAYAPHGRAKKILHPKRRMLLAAAAAKESAGATIALAVSATNPDTCDGCLACAKICPTGARLPSAINGMLQFDPLYCIGCAGCAGACPTGSITLTTILANEASCYDDDRETREESCT